jgi:hypothetical protein
MSARLRAYEQFASICQHLLTHASGLGSECRMTCIGQPQHMFTEGNPAMTRSLLIAAIVSFSIGTAGAALAQAAMSEPGLYAFYHPNGDVLHASPQYSPRDEAIAARGVSDALALVTVVRPAHGHKHNRVH